MNPSRASLRQAILDEMEETLVSFRALLETIPPEALELPTANPVWNVREVLYHMSLAPRFMLADTRMIIGYTRQHRWLYGVIERFVPKRLFDWLNEIYTRFRARGASLQSLAAEYERAHQMATRALAEVADDQFEMSLRYPAWDPLLTGQITVEKLFRYVKDHYETHAQEVLRALDGPAAGSKHGENQRDAKGLYR